MEKRRVRSRGGCNSADVSSPQQHILVLERSRRRTKRCRGRAGLQDVSTPSGNKREQESHRKPRSHGAADLTMLQLRCPTGQVHPAGTVGTGGHCSDPVVSRPPPLALEGQKGSLSRRQSKPQRAIPVWGDLVRMLLSLFQQIPISGLCSSCCIRACALAGVWSQAGAWFLCPRAGDIPHRLLVCPGHRCLQGVPRLSLFLLLLCLSRS